jgi:hypothetical protein
MPARVGWLPVWLGYFVSAVLGDITEPLLPPPPVHVRIREPANGTSVVGPSVTVGLKLYWPKADAAFGAAEDDRRHTICMSLDWGGKSCGALADVLRQPIALHNVLPGWRRLRAWIEPPPPPDSADPRYANSTSDFLVRGAGYVAGGGGGGGGGGGDEEEEYIDVTLARSTGTAVGTAAQCVGEGGGGGCGGGGAGAAAGGGPERGTEERARYFDAIYKDSLWAAGGAGARSGTGSTLAFTRNAGVALSAALREAVTLPAGGGRAKGGVRLLDVPCGDMTWMPDVVAPFMAGSGSGGGGDGGLAYTGYDISGLIIEENRRRFAARPGFSFDTFDVVEQDIAPRGRFDVIFCRHLMFHLTPAHNMRLLRRFERSGAKYLMATTYLRANENDKDFVLAFGHKVNLFRPPYCMRDPLRMYVDGEADMMLGLWQIADDDGNVLPLLGWDKECMR